MSKESDALANLLLAGKQFVDAIREPDAKRDGGGTVTIKRADLEHIIGVMDDPDINKVIPGALLRALFPLRTAWNEDRRKRG